MVKFVVSIVLAATLGLALGVGLAAPARRPAAEILGELDALKFPGGFLDDEGVKELERVCRRRCELGRELFDDWPEHPRTPKAIEERWMLLSNTFGEHTAARAEAEQVLESGRGGRFELLALRARAWSASFDETVSAEKGFEFVDEARRAGADGDWTATVLLTLAQERTIDVSAQRRACERIAGELDAAAELRTDAQRWTNLLARVGKPLELGYDGFTLEPWRGKPILLHVRSTSDWKPLPESELEQIESRHATCGAAVVELVMGTPDEPSSRTNRRLVAPEFGPEEGWQTRFGLWRSSIELVVDADGLLRAVTYRITTAERALASLCGEP